MSFKRRGGFIWKLQKTLARIRIRAFVSKVKLEFVNEKRSVFNATVKNVSFVIVLERILKFKEKIVKCARKIVEENGLEIMRKEVVKEVNMRKLSEGQILTSKY